MTGESWATPRCVCERLGIWGWGRSKWGWGMVLQGRWKWSFVYRNGWIDGKSTTITKCLKNPNLLRCYPKNNGPPTMGGNVFKKISVKIYFITGRYIHSTFYALEVVYKNAQYHFICFVSTFSQNVNGHFLWLGDWVIFIVYPYSYLTICSF